MNWVVAQIFTSFVKARGEKSEITSNSCLRQQVGHEPVCNKFQKQTIMKNLFVKIAGMSVCVLGVLSTTCCSKEDFFGLEDSVYLDNSLKTEIAMSQEFADYSLACFNLMQEMSQSVDTTGMEIQGIVNGNPIFYKTGSDKTVKNKMI